MKRKTKSKKKERKTSEPLPWITRETKGVLALAFALIFFLSLVSFSVDPDADNLLGLMGHTLGWASLASIGLSSYFLSLYIGWIGWRQLFGKPLHLLWLKTSYLLAALISISILLSAIERDFPYFGALVREAFFPGLVEKAKNYHLGGALFYFFYQDLPGFNLRHIFNTTGVMLIFSAIFLSSLFFLFKVRLTINLKYLADIIKAGLQERRERLGASEGIHKEKKDTPNQEETPDKSDFFRLVKLRIPSTPQEGALKVHSPSSSSDVLAIRPEKNLKERPSLSKKGQEEEEEMDFKPSFFKSKSTPPPSFLSPTEEEKFPEKKESGSKKELEKAKKRELALMDQTIQNGDFTHYVIPSTNLLSHAKKADQSAIKKDLKRQAEVLEETLQSFGIEAKVGQINCGPTITSFEVHPAIGVKVQRIKTLDNDIALNMEAKSIRIIAPIPGKAAVGIEVPNPQPQEVGFKEMLTAYQQRTERFHIPILLGQAVNGDYVMSDLAKMPHCIIAGATGSGKSVCINTIIMSILLNAKPDQIKLLMVDPKKVELTPYTRLPHMLAPVITEPAGAAAALNWLVKEMEKRYEILKLVGVRNIDSFNKRSINQAKEDSLGIEIPSFMPYIVGIIDELADLMMVASGDIETPIARIAQMARAVGIHLILATQRPSREVITGLIKANFPTRISFKVASRVNSQIVLDETGAESLLGNGDMLFLPPGSSHLIRAQGAFIRDEDIQSVVQKICEQAPPQYVIQSFDRYFEIEGESKGDDAIEALDSLYEQAKEIVLNTGNASTTFLQRKLKIGYARAASLMDQLETQGVVGPAEGSRPRKIFGTKKEGQEEEGELI